MVQRRNEETGVVKNIGKSFFMFNFSNILIFLCLGQIFSCASLNVIWNLIAAGRFNYDDENMFKLIGIYFCQYFLSIFTLYSDF